MRQVCMHGMPIAHEWHLIYECVMQAAFHVFGMELLARLDLSATNDFFATFFRLPDSFWRGFLASQLSSSKLVVFALLTFVLAPTKIRWHLVHHFLSHPAGIYMLRTYAGKSPVFLLQT